LFVLFVLFDEKQTNFFIRGNAAAHFSWHNSPITSVEWKPNDGSVLAVSSSDQITLWDLSLEKDAESEADANPEDNYPPQLLFVHQGQESIKELHWHKQIPGLVLSTAASGFHLFKTFNID